MYTKTTSTTNTTFVETNTERLTRIDVDVGIELQDRLDQIAFELGMSVQEVMVQMLEAQVRARC